MYNVGAQHLEPCKILMNITGCWRWFDFAHHDGTPTTTIVKSHFHTQFLFLSHDPDHVHLWYLPGGAVWPIEVAGIFL
jgi:hypothetical protein